MLNGSGLDIIFRWNVNCFYIALYVLNLVNHSNKSHFDVFFSLAPVSFVVYYRMNCFYDQYISIYGIILMVLLHFHDLFFVFIYLILSPLLVLSINYCYFSSIYLLSIVVVDTFVIVCSYY